MLFCQLSVKFKVFPMSLVFYKMIWNGGIVGMWHSLLNNLDPYCIFFLCAQHVSNKSHPPCKYFHETKSLELKGSGVTCTHMSLALMLNYSLEKCFQFISASG